MSNRCKVCDHRAVAHGDYGCNYSMSVLGLAPEARKAAFCACLISKHEIRAGKDSELVQETKV